MKNIAIRIQNTLLAEGIILTLKESGNFECFKLPLTDVKDAIMDCEVLKPDILLMGVSYMPNETLEKCLDISDAVHRNISGCKVVLICDEISNPELANELVNVKQVGRIDEFLYTSIGGSYMTAALSTL